MSRRERAEWLASLPVEQRVRLAYGEPVRYHLGDDLRTRSRPGRQFRPCLECGHVRRHAARGFCSPCYRRKRRAGALPA